MLTERETFKCISNVEKRYLKLMFRCIDKIDFSNKRLHQQSLDKHEIIEIVEKFVDNIVMKCNVKHYSEIDKIRTIVSKFRSFCFTGLTPKKH